MMMMTMRMEMTDDDDEIGWDDRRMIQDEMMTR